MYSINPTLTLPNPFDFAQGKIGEGTSEFSPKPGGDTEGVDGSLLLSQK